MCRMTGSKVILIVLQVLFFLVAIIQNFFIKLLIVKIFKFCLFLTENENKRIIFD